MLIFCLDSRVSEKYRKKAQELYIEYRDFKSIERFLEDDYKNITLIIDCPPQITDDEVASLKMFSKQKNDLICALHNYNQLGERFVGLRWYVMTPCNSFMEAIALQDAGAEYIVLGETMFFNIQRVKDCGIQNVRIMANQAAHSPIPRTNGICGPWVRPEDLQLYDEFHKTVIEFPGLLPNKEEALYRIYAEQHRWPGAVEMIIENFDSPCENRMLPTEFTEHRLNCRQRCNTCHICPNLVRLANRLLADAGDIKLFLEKN